MGCSTSKSAARKRAARESWYAPVARSFSAPIHYPAEGEEDSCHVVSLASSSYGIMQAIEGPGEHISKGSSMHILEDKWPPAECIVDGGNHAGLKREPAIVMVPRPHLRCSLKLKPVEEEVLENEIAGPETINTWELMQDVDEEEKPTSIYLTAATAAKCRTMSFSVGQVWDLSLTDISSPVWRKYYMQGARDEKVNGHRKPGFIHHQSSLSFGGAEEHLYHCYSRYPEAKTLMRSARPRSPTSGKATNSSVENPEANSAYSPRFDRSLMATFEQAVQGITAPAQELGWASTHDDEERSSTNTSASSSGNHAWAMSETSSDAESAHLEYSGTLHQRKWSPATRHEMSAEVAQWHKGAIKEERKTLCTLESLEARCPPQGKERVVLYFTSLRGVRKTYEECCELRCILQGLGVYVDERDVWMHSKFREELTEVLGNRKVQVPRLFVKGRYIGGIEEVRRLHDNGDLVRFVDGLPLLRNACDGCADMRFIPCSTCSGSCKVVNDMDQYVRCTKCNENGLVMCPLCT